MQLLKIYKTFRARGIHLCLVLATVFCSSALHAQSLKVKGVVTSADDGTTMPGATILVKGTSNGTITDIDGKYSIDANVGDVLTYSFTGFKTVERRVAGEVIDIALELDVTSLEEIVVIGYGEQKKKEVTGAVAHVKSEDLNNIVASDVSSSLQGRIPGVNVTAQSGEPGAESVVLIRGITSVSGSNEPLYVVDGVIQPEGFDPQIPASQIESIDILKDAASASIYGVRAAGGAILITTKKGTPGTTKVNFNASYGINDIDTDLPLMNTEEQLFYETSRLRYVAGAGNPGLVQNPEWIGNNTDIRSLVQNDGAATQNYSLNVSGGQKGFSYNLTLGLFDQEGLVGNSNFTRYSGRVTTSYKGKKFGLDASLAFQHEVLNRVGSGLLPRAIEYLPYQPGISSGSEEVEVLGGFTQTRLDNLLQSLRGIDETNRDRVNGNVTAKYELVKGLELRTVFGGGIRSEVRENFVPPYGVFNRNTGVTEVDPTRNFIQFRNTRIINWSSTYMATYRKKFGGHKFTILGSLAIDGSERVGTFARREGLIVDNINKLDNGTISIRAEGNGLDFKNVNVGIIGRVQYDFKSRYLFSASVRRDASSKFPTQNRWGTFPSVSVGWNVADEAFFEPVSEVIPTFKVRFGHGRVGNDRVQPYTYQGAIQLNNNYAFGNSTTFGATQTAFANADLKWETKIENNLGFDIGLFNNKTNITADFYRSERADMLMPILAGLSNGVPNDGGTGSRPTVLLNVGNMTNTGIDLALTQSLISGGFNLNVTATYSTAKNEITEIFGEREIFFSGRGASILGDGGSSTTATAVGREASAFYLHRTDGVINSEEELEAYQKLVPTAQMGDLIYVDTNGDSTISTDDREYMGSPFPAHELGLITDIKFKGFDFNMQWYASLGHEVINGSKAHAFTKGRHRGLVNMWTPVNNDAELPIFREESKGHPNYSGITDLWIEDGSFARLKVITLGYSLPKQLIERVGFTKVRFYVSAQNVLTITKYTGYDPEIGNNNLFDRGVDLGRYPFSKTYLAGLNLTF